MKPGMSLRTCTGSLARRAQEIDGAMSATGGIDWCARSGSPLPAARDSGGLKKCVPTPGRGAARCSPRFQVERNGRLLLASRVGCHHAGLGLGEAAVCFSASFSGAASIHEGRRPSRPRARGRSLDRDALRSRGDRRRGPAAHDRMQALHGARKRRTSADGSEMPRLVPGPPPAGRAMPCPISPPPTTPIFWEFTLAMICSPIVRPQVG